MEYNRHGFRTILSLSCSSHFSLTFSFIVPFIHCTVDRMFCARWTFHWYPFLNCCRLLFTLTFFLRVSREIIHYNPKWLSTWQSFYIIIYLFVYLTLISVNFAWQIMTHTFIYQVNDTKSEVASNAMCMLY